MSRRPTINDIAEAAGVSIGAVSFALNDRPGVSARTRERIRAIADEMGWQPNAAARGLSVARAEAIGLVIARDAATLGVEPFYMKFIAGLETELSATGTALVLQVVADHDRAIDALRSLWAARRIDATILTDLWADDTRVAALTALGLPGVLVGHPRPGSPVPAVWSDDAAALTEAINYLAGIGHRRIARVAGLPALEHTRIRTAAFRTAATRHGLDTAEVVDTDYSWEAGAWATEQLLTSARPPTAITYDNDIMATAGLHVARKLGLDVPTDLSIIAGDDSQLCEMAYPALSALARDVHAYGANAARTLLALLAGAPPDDFQDATPASSSATASPPPPTPDPRQHPDQDETPGQPSTRPTWSAANRNTASHPAHPGQHSPPSPANSTAAAPNRDGDGATPQQNEQPSRQPRAGQPRAAEHGQHGPGSTDRQLSASGADGAARTGQRGRATTGS